MLAFVAFLSFLLVASSRFAIADDTDPVLEPDNVFILAGQSNMAGRGGVVNDTWDHYIPPESRPDPNILRFNPTRIWEIAQEPLHLGIDLNKTVGIGPGLPFARALLKSDPNLGVIGLVPCAAGGTNISEWARAGKLYNRLIRRSTAAASGGAEIRALVWYQGESDTVDLDDARKYRSRLRRFFVHVRSDLGLPDLPIIQVALATKQGEYIDIVRQAQFTLDLPGVKTVDAKGLQAGNDYLHLTTASQVLLGQMLANAFLDQMPPPVHLQTSSATRRQGSFVSGFLCRPFR